MWSWTWRSARRSGVPAGDQAIALAQLVDKLPHLKLRGLISYDGGAQHIKGFKTRLEQTLNRFAPSVETFERFKRSGLSTEIFSGGGTGTYNILPRAGGVTDVQVGSYVFMDCQYLEIGGETQRRGLRRFPAVAHRRDDGAQHLLPQVDHHRRGREGADAEPAGALGDRRARVQLQRGVRRVRRDPVRDGRSGRTRSATSSS